MSGFKPYPEYKDSGVEWLGEVPANWDVLPLKYLAMICNGRDYKDVEQLDGPYPVLGSGGEFARASHYLYEGQSVLLGRKGTVDKPLFVQGRFWTVDTMFYTAVFGSTDPRFLFYCSLPIPFQYYSTNTALPSMTQEALGNHVLAAPDRVEQSLIARFLDHETAKIDALIAEQQRLIELLQEKRQAVISHDVTKGLNPDAPMKDSGVEWIGEVPEHWEVVRFKWRTKTASGGTPPAEPEGKYYGGEIPWLRSLDLNDDLITEHAITVTEDAIKETSCRIVPKDSVLVAMYGGDGTIGKNGLLTFDSAINQALCAFLPSDHISPSYLHKYIQYYRPYWMYGAESARKDPNIGQDRIGSHYLVIPPKFEQADLVRHIEQQEQKYDSLLSGSSQSIEILQERRSALISAAVTGKIDVRDWQPPERDSVELTADTEAA